MRSSFICGLSGLAITEDERNFLRDTRPAGVILFARNFFDHTQILRLLEGVRTSLEGSDLLILTDQEGGRVQRLRPPLGRRLPSGSAYAKAFVSDPAKTVRKAYCISRLLAADLFALGINTNCAPVLDLLTPETHKIIGDRAYGDNPEQVVQLASAVAQGLLDGGVLPVMKHIPGHGRAPADSHLDLPVVKCDHKTLLHTDFAPFRKLNDLPIAMTSHVLFSRIDPSHPASTSSKIVDKVIRGTIGFNGLLMSDDIGMQALSGTFEERTAAVLDAGVDLALHCSGNLNEAQAVAKEAKTLEGDRLCRFEISCALIGKSKRYDVSEAMDALKTMLAS